MRARMRGLGGAVAVSAGAAGLLLLGFLRERAGQGAGVTRVVDRQAMGEMELAEVGGGTWRLRDHRNQVVAINLWATWCGPCQEETPGIVRAVREMGASGFSAVGISLDDNNGGEREEKVRTFARRYGVEYPMAFPDAMSQMAAGMEGIPTTLLVDRQGRVAKTYVGAVRESVLRRDVAMLLAER